MLAPVAAREGIADEAIADEAREIAARTGHERRQALLAHARGAAAGDEGALAEALGAYEKLGLAFERALCLFDLARLHERRDAPPEIVAGEISSARELAERVGAHALASVARDMELAATLR